MGTGLGGFDTEQPVGTAAGGASGPRAGFWRRLGAALIDGLLIGVVTGILGAVVDGGAGIALSTVLSYGYYTYLEGGPKGQTLGKQALGIRVIDANGGGSIGFARAFLRNVFEIVSALALFLGYLWMIWDGEKQTWHDKVSSSYVVPVSDYPTT